MEKSLNYGTVPFYFFSDFYSVMGILKKFTNHTLSPLSAKIRDYFMSQQLHRQNSYIVLETSYCGKSEQKRVGRGTL
jgi:hypothetical protein